VALSVTGFVLPSSVRLPSICVTLPSALKVNLLATRCDVGKAATLSISSLEMCLVNAAVPVSSEVVSTVTSSEPVLAALSIVTVPVVLLKRPRLVEVPKWAISHEANEWLGSSA
jgi:hypothetical protein